MNRNNFDFLYVIGKGGFGKVWKVKSKKTKISYALKEMSKLKVIDKKSIKSINSERELLSKLHHPFIVNMHYAFQDNENLYLVMDLQAVIFVFIYHDIRGFPKSKPVFLFVV